jgi:anaerobic magnesium-protoporphyrin IX monomethyl ester cyclase
MIGSQSKMKILFILPRFNKGFGTVYNENETGIDYDYLMPVGMPYIAAYLKQNGYKDVSALNLNHVPGLIKDIVQKAVTDNHYDFVFTGTISIMYPAVRDIIKWVREASPDTITVCGGGIISSNPELMMKLIRPHFGIIFEGEETALELIQTIENKKSTDNIPGICYLTKGTGGLYPSQSIHITKPRPAIKDLNALPFPDLELFGYSEYLKHQELGGWNQYPRDHPPRPYMLAATRSCPMTCNFCFHTTGSKYRQRSIENIMAEVKYAVEKYHINFFTFLDECFAYDKPRALEFCRQFKEYQKTIPWRIEMYCNLRVDCADAEILDAMKSCGNVVIGLGLESYDQRVLNSMKKHICPLQIHDTLKMIAERNLVPQGGFIFGDPAETLETAKETLDFIKNHPQWTRGGLFMGFIIPFPGTTIYKYALQKGIIKDETEFINKLTSTDYNYDNVYNFTSLSDRDFDKLKDEVFTLKYISIPVSVPSIITSEKIFVKCPHCGKMQSYKTTKVPHAQFSVGVICNNPECNGRFEMGTRYIQLGRLMVKLLGFKRMRQIKNLVGI